MNSNNSVKLIELITCSITNFGLKVVKRTLNVQDMRVKIQKSPCSQTQLCTRIKKELKLSVHKLFQRNFVEKRKCWEFQFCESDSFFCCKAHQPSRTRKSTKILHLLSDVHLCVATSLQKTDVSSLNNYDFLF
jgi:hypothetical protein